MLTPTRKNGSRPTDEELEQYLLEAAKDEPELFDDLLERVEAKHDRQDDIAIREALWRLFYRQALELTNDLRIRKYPSPAAA